ncbi:vacuolar acid trehalase [Perilla frutescens var. frutescens]|nr:vacuolar acid trehalase [Perilla frutescens var. frutescens]
MASSLLISKQNSIFQFPSVILHYPKTQYPLNSCILNFPSSAEAFSHLNLKLNHRISRASPEGLSLSLSLSLVYLFFQRIVHIVKLDWVSLGRCSSLNCCNDLPTEFVEDSKFVPLTSEDPSYGPPALLLLGFQVEEAAKIQQLLKELEGEFLEMIFCTEDMINCSLWEAVNTKQSNLEALKVAKSLPRICFLSGLTGEEMMMLIDAFPESGLEPPVFAAVVPNSAEKPLAELIDEIMGDHEMLSARTS